VQRKGGGYLEVEFLSLPIPFRNRPVVLSLGRDLTERKKLEAQIALGERLVAMGRLVAGIGHEINNPLAYVMANLEMLVPRLRENPADPENFELLADCRDGVDRIHRIIKGLKGLSRGGDRPVPVDIRRLLERAIAMTRNEVRHRAQLACSFGDIPDVMADEIRLAQVFVNLLVNAAQSIPAGQAEANEISIATSTDNQGRARIEIRDSGCGIAQTDLERIFDPFFTTKAVGVGTGLGLSISHSIVTEYGGTFEVDSQLGRGTTFSVILPAAPRRELEVDTDIAGHASSVRGRVLVIDDEPAIGLAVRRALAAEHDVVIAGSGRDAIAQLEQGEAFDAILCDLMMPEVTGMDVYEWLRMQRPELLHRVLFLTGGAFTEVSTEFVRSRDVELLDKPFLTSELRTRVRAVVERSSGA
jgi:nitrogen-specific signal transduction histidine kinase/CheY-like chemotaxis protein